jgi:hypothetical protein
VTLKEIGKVTLKDPQPGSNAQLKEHFERLFITVAKLFYNSVVESKKREKIT